MNNIAAILRALAGPLGLLVVALGLIDLAMMYTVTGNLTMAAFFAFALPFSLVVGVLGGLTKKTNAIGAFFKSSFLLIAFQFIGLWLVGWTVVWIGLPWQLEVLGMIIVWILGFFTTGKIAIGLKFIVNPDPQTAHGVIAGSVLIAMVMGLQGYKTNGRMVSGNSMSRLRHVVIADSPYQHGERMYFGHSDLQVKVFGKVIYGEFALVPDQLDGSGDPEDFCKFDRSQVNHRRALHYWSDPVELGGCGIAIDSDDGDLWRACNIWLESQGVKLDNLCDEDAEKIEIKNPTVPFEYKDGESNSSSWAPNAMQCGVRELVKGRGESKPYDLGHLEPGQSFRIMTCDGSTQAKFEWGPESLGTWMPISSMQTNVIEVSSAFTDHMLPGESVTIVTKKRLRVAYGEAERCSEEILMELCGPGTNANRRLQTRRIGRGDTPTGSVVSTPPTADTPADGLLED